MKDTARWVALGALFLVPFTPLIVANSYFFPFITGKAFFFRILVEIAFGAWVVLTLLDRDYRPRRSWLGVCAVALVVWMFIADLFALNVTKAFWSNFERMEGWVWLAHLLAFFFVASNVLRVEKKWRSWFLTSLGVSVIISLHALLQLSGHAVIHQSGVRVDASFGNAAYLAVYLLLNVFVASWIALTEKRVWLKWSLIVLACAQGTLIFFTETRGAILGLVGSLALAALLTALTGGQKARRGAALGLIGLLVVVGGVYANRDTEVIQDNRLLNRVTSISLEEGKTRFTIWSMALEGAKERPVAGWGQEGFNYVFNKYYQPSLHGQESWFDRAHNVYLDWLIAGGLPAFLLYIALFGVAVVSLWRHSELSRPERILLTAAFAGYAFHNIFVFDNLYSYIYFFALLALIDSQVSRPTKLAEAQEWRETDITTYAVPVTVAVTLVLVWAVNVTNIQKASTLITAISPQQGFDANLAAFETLTEKQGFGAQEIREQLVSFASRVAREEGVNTTQKQLVAALSILKMQEHADTYPLDARLKLQLGYAYRVAGDYDRAIEEVLAAQALSPGKPAMWIEAGITSWGADDIEAAHQYFDKAYELLPVPDLAAYKAAALWALGDKKEAIALLTDTHGTAVVDSDILVAAYYRTKNWQGIIDIYELRAGRPDASVQKWFDLASAYYTAGRVGKAVEVLRETVTRFPETAEDVSAVLKQLKGGG